MTLFSKQHQQILNGIVTRNKLANSYLFHGQKGSFIANAAVYFASYVNCAQPVDEEPCHTCRSCTQIQEGSHVDVIQVLEEDKKITVEVIRKLQERVKYGSSTTSHLMVIIHNAHSMTDEAANAFLKTLEEPPAGVCFILLSQNALSLLPTIRSRSQSLGFPQVPYPELLDHIKSHFDEKKQAEIEETCHQQPLLLIHYLEGNDLSEFPYIPYAQLCNQDTIELFRLAEKLAKNKPTVSLFLHTWSQEMWQLNELHHMNSFVQAIPKLNQNVNVRLLLENLFLPLCYSK